MVSYFGANRMNEENSLEKEKTKKAQRASGTEELRKKLAALVSRGCSQPMNSQLRLLKGDAGANVALYNAE